MQTREEIVKAFTPIEPKFLTQTQKAVLGKLHMAFLDLATTIEMDVPACADRTSALHKLMECKFSCSQAVTHTGYEKKEEKDGHHEKALDKEKVHKAS